MMAELIAVSFVKKTVFVGQTKINFYFAREYAYVLGKECDE